MSEVVSEDSVRRHLGKIDEQAGVAWLQEHLGDCVAPLLSEPWMLDVDVTVKPLDGHQEGAVKGDHPHTPGRSSPTDHRYFLSSLRLILDVAVKDGHQCASKDGSPERWERLARRPRTPWPSVIRGDRVWCTPANMARAEQEDAPSLFKLRMTAGVKKTVERLMRGANWCKTGQGWPGTETRQRLAGWGRARRTIVLRRHIKADLAMVERGDPEQRCLRFAELPDESVVYEHAVWVTSLAGDILTAAQMYRDRAKADNPFDALKNHWGWAVSPPRYQG